MGTNVGQALNVLALLRQYDRFIEVFFQYPRWVNILRPVEQPSLIAYELPASAEDLLLGGFPGVGVLVEVGGQRFGLSEVGVDLIHSKIWSS